MTIHQTKMRPAITPAEQRFLDLYASVADQLPGSQSQEVRFWRAAALERFSELGWPHRRIEEWKYTDLRMLMPEVLPFFAELFPASAADISVEAAIGKQLAHLDAYRFVFIDGVFQRGLSTPASMDGVSFTTLRESLEDGSFNEYVRPSAMEKDVIGNLAAAFATDGAILSIRRNMRLEKPIHLIFIASQFPKLAATRNQIHLEDGAEVQLIETHAAAGLSQSFSSMDIVAGKGAHLKHVRSNAGGKNLASTAVLLNERTEYDPLQMTVDGALTRAEMRIRFAGPNARCHYSGAMMLRDHSHADFTLVVVHAAEACESRELVKAVVDGRSRGVFQGKVVVERGAQKTDGKQMANALLLSDEAEFDSKPELEIFADDVVCGHGATAGQLDEDMLFYLRARGIPETQARALLIQAFMGEALGKIENEALRDALLERTAAWLAAGSGKLGERS
jgi:Fe-S cluster assembly protein SufD